MGSVSGENGLRGRGSVWRTRRLVANQDAGDEAEQGKNTEVRQRKSAANQKASDKAEQGKNTEARQRMRAEIRVIARTEIQPRAQPALYRQVRPGVTPRKKLGFVTNSRRRLRNRSALKIDPPFMPRPPPIAPG